MDAEIPAAQTTPGIWKQIREPAAREPRRNLSTVRQRAAPVKQPPASRG
jgi:hypothetical protein